MPKFFLSNKAVEDLSNIWNYTYETWSENQADKYYNLLIDSCKAISENPTIGKNYYEIDKSIYGYKTGRHIIFYITVQSVQSNEIEVLRILHESMDLRNKLQE